MRKLLVTSVALALLAGGASASTIVLDFEGVPNLGTVGDFYNGGAGTDYNITFNGNALGIIDADAGGSGNFGSEPSPDTVLFFLSGSAATMNVFDGFTTGFSFFYSSVNYGGSVNVWSGLDGTGDLLATLTLAALGYGPGDPTGDFSNWADIGVTFDGIAHSVDFAGTADQIAFDDVTIGNENAGGDPSPVPAPAALPLLLMALGSFGIAARRKRA